MPQTSQLEVPKDIQHQLLTEYPGNESAQEGVVNVTVASGETNQMFPFILFELLYWASYLKNYT